MRKTKRALTLLEIMIVIMLIGLIGSVIGVNMKGSLDEGRAFKTEQARQQMLDIFTLEVARGTPVQDVLANKEAYLANSGLVKDPEKFLKDGWGHPFIVRLDEDNETILILSQKLTDYQQKKNAKLQTAASKTAD